MKYWDKARIRRVRERKRRAEMRAAERSAARYEKERTYSAGDVKKNAALMLDALGLPLRRRMLSRLRQGGAMSVSKLVEPFRITLPSALQHVGMLERAGIITTKKQGRVRMCVYNKAALKELAEFLTGDHF